MTALRFAFGSPVMLIAMHSKALRQDNIASSYLPAR
jgi:hypothetical protein